MYFRFSSRANGTAFRLHRDYIAKAEAVFAAREPEFIETLWGSAV